jgi:hypothetical protein
VYYSQNLYSIRKGLIEHEHFLKAGNRKDSQRGQVRVDKPRMPTYVGLCGQQAERLMGGQEKAVTKIRARLSCEVIRLIVEVVVGLGSDDVDRVHRELAFFRRSSSRRCFSCQ